MRRQFYFVLDKKKELELFQFVKERYSLEVLPALIICEHGVLPELGKYLLVNVSDVDQFCYDKQINEQKQCVKVIRPFDNCQNILPYIEYSYECYEHRIVARLWGPSTTANSGNVLAKKMKDICVWANDNCVAKEKDGPIWTYHL